MLYSPFSLSFQHIKEITLLKFKDSGAYFYIPKEKGAQQHNFQLALAFMASLEHSTHSVNKNVFQPQRWQEDASENTLTHASLERSLTLALRLAVSRFNTRKRRFSRKLWLCLHTVLDLRFLILL